jgi:hypothetical protein
MHIMVTSTYPGTKVEEVVKIWMDGLQADPVPDSVKMMGPFGEWSGGGAKAYICYELEKGMEDDAMIWIAKGISQLTEAIDGYSVSVEVVYPLQQSLEIAGISVG